MYHNKLDMLIEWRKYRAFGTLEDVFASALILILYYGLNNKIAAYIILSTYILNLIANAHAVQKIDDIIEIEINKENGYEL